MINAATRPQDTNAVENSHLTDTLLTRNHPPPPFNLTCIQAPVPPYHHWLDHSTPTMMLCRFSSTKKCFLACRGKDLEQQKCYEVATSLTLSPNLSILCPYTLHPTPYTPTPYTPTLYALHSYTHTPYTPTLLHSYTPHYPPQLPMGVFLVPSFHPEATQGSYCRRGRRGRRRA